MMSSVLFDLIYQVEVLCLSRSQFVPPVDPGPPPDFRLWPCPYPMTTVNLITSFLTNPNLRPKNLRYRPHAQSPTHTNPPLTIAKKRSDSSVCIDMRPNIIPPKCLFFNSTQSSHICAYRCHASSVCVWSNPAKSHLCTTLTSFLLSLLYSIPDSADSKTWQKVCAQYCNLSDSTLPTFE